MESPVALTKEFEQENTIGLLQNSKRNNSVRNLKSTYTSAKPFINAHGKLCIKVGHSIY